MGLLFMIVVGGILGWLAAIILKIESPRGVLLNIAAGVSGALFTGLLAGSLLGGSSLLGGHYQVESLLLSLVGSIVVVASFNLIYRQQLH
jgi:uncharacterized membrane protein YeaQ/YmgE (transglycosylase-associated protein family)